MKRKSKFLALVLAAALSFPVSACGSADAGNPGTEGTSDSKEADLLTAAQDKMKDVTSLNGKMVMEMDINVGMGGETQSMQTTTTTNMSCFYNPTRFKMDMAMDLGEAGSTNMEIYAETTEDGTCTLYLGDGTSWQTQTVEMGDLAQYDAANKMTESMRSSYNFQDVGTEQVDGKDARKFTGAIKGDDMKDAVLSSGVMTSLSALGIDASKMADMLQDIDEIPITLWIDEADSYPVKYEMDMTSVMNSVISALLESIGEQTEGVTMEFTKMHLIMTCSDFNAATEFSIPDAAKGVAPAA